ncbi:hypothetical protein [Hydrogenophaga sp.]|uniref:hypothetical protein n=1 Tax=Hydrogenophaga sp. TaxID=1904254 RepID=UPI00271CBE52|nr:hypothetical protein [Hydrogenophaga sp.]MDO9438550.1 hypothetical protein [Hydrogenophaga sp.]
MAELRCKPGDIAMLTSRANVGKLVRVIERSPDWSDQLYGSPSWEIESMGSPLHIFELDTWEPVGQEMRTRAPDCRLVPLRDSPQPIKARRRRLTAHR